MERILKATHLWGSWRRLCMFLVNHIFTGMGNSSFAIKRFFLNRCGNAIGKGTSIVSPVFIRGRLIAGNACWINCGFKVHGNGTVVIGDRCDIAPDVTILTGGHQIGSADRRAGIGENYTIKICDGCWIGSRTTILGNTVINKGSVVAACSCVIHDVEPSTLVGGVPAKVIRKLDKEKGNAENE